MSPSRLLRLALVLAALSAGACSSDKSSSTSSGATTTDNATKAIGPDGGTIEVGGAVVTFPKGSVAKETMITISVEDATKVPTGFVALSKLFKCEPSGTDFAQPVEMRMPFTDDGKGGTLFWSTGADPTFKDLGGRVEGTTMIATVLHFSSGFVGRKQ
jgi:hypothetical protein